MICHTTFVSDDGYAYVAGEHITPYEFDRLTATEKTYFSGEDILEDPVLKKYDKGEGLDPDYYED